MDVCGGGTVDRELLRRRAAREARAARMSAKRVEKASKLEMASAFVLCCISSRVNSMKVYFGVEVDGICDQTSIDGIVRFKGMLTVRSQ